MSSVPDVLPVLSRGKHRSPKRGACFMELASYLAGERWSDRPACTHPLLAEVARNVNDRISDENRAALALLIPDVVGLTSDDPRVDARIALHCALVALVAAPFERQKAIAVGVLACEQALTDLGDLDYATQVRIRRGLESAPQAAAWAARFAERAGGRRTSLRRFRHSAAQDIVKLATRGAELSSASDRDDLLRRMLEGSIEVCRSLQPAVAPAELDAGRWREACSLTV